MKTSAQARTHREVARIAEEDDRVVAFEHPRHSDLDVPRAGVEAGCQDDCGKCVRCGRISCSLRDARGVVESPERSRMKNGSCVMCAGAFEVSHLTVRVCIVISGNHAARSCRVLTWPLCQISPACGVSTWGTQSSRPWIGAAAADATRVDMAAAMAERTANFIMDERVRG
jgi:hypothetical protein